MGCATGCAGAGAASPSLRVASPPTPPPTFHDSSRRTKIAATASKLDALFAGAAAKQKLPGLAVGLVVDGDLVWSKGYGTRTLAETAPVDADTVFRIGSITKTFTATAALQLRDLGRIGLDEPASRWIPELGDVVYPTGDSPPITMRDLLTHTSGLPRLGGFDYADAKKAPTEQDIVSSLHGFALEYTPGVGSEYSNLGGALAGLIVGRAAKMRYRDYVSAYLLHPLGMTSTTWDPESVSPNRLASGYARENDGAPKLQEHWRLGASEGAGGLYSTLHDLARWAAMYLQAFPPRDDRDPWPVKRATLREAMTTQHAYGLSVGSDKPPIDASATGVGFAWQTLQSCDLEDVVWHNGGTEGYSSMLAMLPARGVAIVALTNVSGADLDSPTIDAIKMLAKSGAIAPREPVAGPALEDARARTLRLFQRWDDGLAQQLFDPGFLTMVGGMARVRELDDAITRKIGVCIRPIGDIEVEGATRGSWRYACERGELEAEAVLSPGVPARVTSMRVHSVIAPNEVLARTATRIASLCGTWDDATYDELLAPTFDRSEMARLFEGVARDAGPCTVDRATESDGATHAKWRLTCAKKALDLELTIDPRNGRANQMLIGVTKSDHDRCPK